MGVGGFMDLLRAGVFMIGVALLVIAALGVAVYLEARWRNPPDVGFYAQCVDRYVVVHASRDLAGVKVTTPEGGILCVFDLVKAGSDALCPVENGTVYVVAVGDVTRVVQCSGPPAPARAD